MPWVGGPCGPADPARIDVALESRAVFGSWKTKNETKSRDLKAARRVLLHLNGPQTVPTVLVTGSKGKGQVAAAAAAHLSAAGLRTGLVSSPGILSNLDRFALDGHVVGVEHYNRSLRRLDEAVSRVGGSPDGYLSPTGLLTVMGHAMLTEAGADVIVHEAGMGGAHDEISLFDRLCVGLTSIFPEHLDVFGPDLEHVAWEKCGLLREGDAAWSVPQSPVPAAILDRVAERTGAEVHTVSPGDVSTQNLALGRALAETAARNWGLRPPSEEIELRRPGRGQTYLTEDGARLMIDASIDPVGCAATIARARRAWGAVDRVVWSAPATKDLAGIADFLDREGVPHEYVALAGSHLDYALTAELRRRLRPRQRDGIMEGIRDRTVFLGTISFGTSLLREMGVTLDRVYGPVRIEAEDIHDTRSSEMAERSLVLVKPDGVERNLVGEVLSRIETKGYRIVELRHLSATREILERHYEEHEGKPFYEPLLEFMMSGPVVAAVIEGDRVIEGVRTLMGPSDPTTAAPGTIRGDLGRDWGEKVQKNLVHGSDSVESAEREISIWFG